MKVLIFSLIYAFSITAAAIQWTPGEQEIIEKVADAYDVDESDVSLVSPNLVLVDQGLSTSQGTATFTDCGNPCTRVQIYFPGLTLDFIVEEEIIGL